VDPQWIAPTLVQEFEVIEAPDHQISNVVFSPLEFALGHATGEETKLSRCADPETLCLRVTFSFFGTRFAHSDTLLAIG
jgi:hypothetical protein